MQQTTSERLANSHMYVAEQRRLKEAREQDCVMVGTDRSDGRPGARLPDGPNDAQCPSVEACASLKKEIKE